MPADPRGVWCAAAGVLLFLAGCEGGVTDDDATTDDDAVPDDDATTDDDTTADDDTGADDDTTASDDDTSPGDDDTPGEDLLGPFGVSMVWMEAGTFCMGSFDGVDDGGATCAGLPRHDTTTLGHEEHGRNVDEVQHAVTLSHGFWIGRTEVTQDQAAQALGSGHENAFPGCADCPAEQLTWHDAAALANAASQAADPALPACYSCSGEGDSLVCDETMDPYTCPGYRLPTEAEWEYAARSHGLSADAYPAGGNLSLSMDTDQCDEAVTLDDDTDLGAQSRYCWNSLDQTWPAGEAAGPSDELVPSADGLYDLSGNVWEWCHDWSADYETGDVSDPAGAGGTWRALRGGSWRSDPRWIRVAVRGGNDPTTRSSGVGVRLARSVP